jgi:hypothetical protein
MKIAARPCLRTRRESHPFLRLAKAVSSSMNDGPTIRRPYNRTTIIIKTMLTENKNGHSKVVIFAPNGDMESVVQRITAHQ